MFGAVRIAALAAAAVSAGSLVTAPAQAQDFYKDKTIALVVATPVGGSYDIYTRVVGRHIGRYIPGHPATLVRNMPGAAGMTSAQYVYEMAPKDGTTLGAPLNTVPMTQITDPSKAKFNSAEFNWIGAVGAPTNVLVTWHTSGVKTIEDAQQKQILVAGTTPSTTTEMYPLMANNLFGTKFKVVMGYENNEISTAMERGEVQGRGANTYKTYYALNPDWMRAGKVHFVFQMNMERDPELPDVPTLLEYAKTDEQRQIIALLATTEGLGRPIMAPPGVPADRVALLRKALMDVVADPKFIEEADKTMLEIGPIPGEKLQAMVASLVATPRDIIEKYKVAVSRRN